MIKRKDELKELDDIEYFDIENLVRLTELTEYFENREAVLVGLRVCPKCGGTIKETQTTGGRYSDGSPMKVYLRVGCENCKYTLHDEVIDI